MNERSSRERSHEMKRLSDVDDDGLCICGGWPIMTMGRRLSIPLGMHSGRAGTKGKGKG